MEERHVHPVDRERKNDVLWSSPGVSTISSCHALSFLIAVCAGSAVRKGWASGQTSRCAFATCNWHLVHSRATINFPLAQPEPTGSSGGRSSAVHGEKNDRETKGDDVVLRTWKAMSSG